MSELQGWASKLLLKVRKSANSWSHSGIANPQILMINPQIGIHKFLQNTAQLCLKNFPKSRLFKTIFLFCAMN
jgi:hypothetical protein